MNCSVNPKVQEDLVDVLLDNLFHVVLFNDDYHTFYEVIEQLMKAINCTKSVAQKYAWTVHNTGKAIVFDGKIEECLRVASVLGEINLKTEIQSVASS